jgi:hypothetical protein
LDHLILAVCRGLAQYFFQQVHMQHNSAKGIAEFMRQARRQAPEQGLRASCLRHPRRFELGHALAQDAHFLL